MQTIDKAVTSKENRFMSRVIRQVTKLRRLLNKKVLLKALATYVSSDSPVTESLVAFVEGVTENDVMQVEAPATASQEIEKNAVIDKKAEEEKNAEIEKKEREEAAFYKKMLSIPEAESFVQLLVTIFLLDKKYLENAISCASSLIQRAQSFNRRYFVEFFPCRNDF